MVNPKVTQLHNPHETSFQENKKDTSLVNRKKRGGIIMNNDNYVTHKELKHFEEKVDLKLENIDTRMKSGFEITNSKIDNLPTTFKNMLLEEREYQNSQKKETQRFIWGTMGIGIVGILLTVVSILISLR